MVVDVICMVLDVMNGCIVSREKGVDDEYTINSNSNCHEPGPQQHYLTLYHPVVLPR